MTIRICTILPFYQSYLSQSLCVPDLAHELAQLGVFVGAGDGQEGGHGPHGAAFQLVLLLVLLLDRVGLNLGGAGILQRFNQFVQLL